MALETVFEKEVCGRCGGGGRYSYCQMYGSVCFGCGGKGERLSKRGAAASAFYVESCKVLAEEVRVGEWIQASGVTMGGQVYNYKAQVVAIGEHVQKYKSGEACSDPNAPWQEAHYIKFEVASKKYGRSYLSEAPGSKVRKFWPAEENAAKLAAAVEYQAGLSKAGKPMKRKAA